MIQTPNLYQCPCRPTPHSATPIAPMSNLAISGGMQRPTRELILNTVADSDDSYKAYDRAILKMIAAMPSCGTYEDCLVKVTVINKLYATNILDVHSMALKIAELDFDRRCKMGDLTLVHDVAQHRYGNNKNYNYSFATKFCCFHSPGAFPIFDSVVRYCTAKLNRHWKFSPIRVYQYWEYDLWKQHIDCFRSFAQADDLDYKTVDKFLWLCGTSKVTEN